MNCVCIQSLMSTHFTSVIPRVTVSSSENMDSYIMQLFPADVWMWHRLRPPYRLDSLALSQFQSNLIIADLPETNRCDTKSSFKHSGKSAYISLSVQLVSTR